MAIQDASVIDQDELLAYLDKENGTFEALDPGTNPGQDVAGANLLNPSKTPATFKALHPLTGKPIKDIPYEQKVALATDRASVRAVNWEPEARAEAKLAFTELTDVQALQRLINMTDAERVIWLDEERKGKNRELILGAFGEKPTAPEEQESK